MTRQLEIGLKNLRNIYERNETSVDLQHTFQNYIDNGGHAMGHFLFWYSFEL